MTWAHYTAELEDINGRKAYAVIDCDKSIPNEIAVKLAYFVSDSVLDRPVWEAVQRNNKDGEQRLLNGIKAEARNRGLKITSEEFTKFSKTKTKGKK